MVVCGCLLYQWSTSEVSNNLLRNVSEEEELVTEGFVDLQCFLIGGHVTLEELTVDLCSGEVVDVEITGLKTESESFECFGDHDGSFLISMEQFGGE